MKLSTLVASGLAVVDAFGGSHSPDCQIPGNLVFAIETQWGDWSSCMNDAGQINYGPNGQCTGAVPQLYQEVCNKAGLHCSHTVVDWTDVWSSGAKGQGWGNGAFHVAGAARITPARLDPGCMVFSNPYSVANDAYLKKAPGHTPNTQAVACAINSWAIGKTQLEQLRDDASWTGPYFSIDDHWTSESDMKAALSGGSCDYAILGSEVADLETVVRIPVSVAGATFGAAFMMDGNDPNARCTLEALNRGIAAVRADGYLTNLFSGYSAIDQPDTTTTGQPTHKTCA